MVEDENEFVIQPTVQIALGPNAGEDGHFTPAEELALKQLGRAQCRVGGVFSPVDRVMQVAIEWKLAREAHLRALHGNPIPLALVKVTKTEIDQIVALAWVVPFLLIVNS